MPNFTILPKASIDIEPVLLSDDKSTTKEHFTEKIIKENPSICTYNAPSLDARQDILVAQVPKSGKEAASKAIKE
ncbi:hypothetical protein Dsin_014562 [Dipteronia sinensis]|uniref:Chalcone/stilbene synthase N-terminal domain-containing protein n=1 Tax=Dipteronia sinensis TaxID=43782 RepID=A0AAE0AMG0_9ROSI|nr:hypothetical protein Dsin_014562 [Dipteronia sinensis]